MNEFDELDDSADEPLYIAGAVTYHTCECGWKRDVPRDPYLRASMYTHRAYGFVSVMQAADMDVKTHHCGLYRRTVNAARATMMLPAKTWSWSL